MGFAYRGSGIGLQPWTKYLRKSLVLIRNSAPREIFNLYFSAVFC